MKNRNLNIRRVCSVVLLLCACLTMWAQENEAPVWVDSVHITWKPRAEVFARLDLSHLNLSADEAVEIIPLMVKAPDTLELPRVLVTRRVRQILNERRGRSEQRYAQIIRRKNKTAQWLDYTAELPAVDWMDGSQLKVCVDRCGCGWQTQPEGWLDLARVTLPREPRFDPQLQFMIPQREEVKMREMSGQAFLDFPVNKITIYPDYRNNPRELLKILATIDSVRHNPYATIRAVTIKGYASPEGSYANNARLAKGRAAALLNHVRGLYDFKGVDFAVESEPEDWAGLDSLVRISNLDAKDEILAVVRDASITDPDVRNSRLQRIQGGKVYRELLTTFYPALRHSDYTVRYHIRNFTLDEAKQLIFTDPKQLSLDEMYRVAQTYEPGSAAFNEVFEIAVRMYPNDPVSNLNAANTALLRKDPEAARRYLRKAQPGPEKTAAEKALQELLTYLNETKK